MTELFETLRSSAFFGLALSCGAWCFGLWVQKKTRLVLCNPLVIASALIILLLSVLHIPYSDYAVGGSLISLMLGPATAVLALNICHEKQRLREYFLPVFVGCLVGTLTSMGLILLLCHLLSVERTIAAALLPKSVTTAIALAISESSGGIPGITAAKIFRVKDPIAEGIAIGACSHALGTAKALEIGELQGAMSSISLCLCGILTSILCLFL